MSPPNSRLLRPRGGLNFMEIRPSESGHKSRNNCVNTHVRVRHTEPMLGDLSKALPSDRIIVTKYLYPTYEMVDARGSSQLISAETCRTI